MKLPINVHDILAGRNVEWERLEFKAGWNPQNAIHTLCAFANDFHNLGGGYLIIGVEEENGRPVLPPKGLSPERLDAIQKEIIELGHRIIPYYHPMVAPYEINGKHILVLWAMGGQSRPYKAPVLISNNTHEYAYYIRKGSVTLRTMFQDEAELMTLAAKIPFDDRRHHTATLNDLDLGLIRSYLQKVKSDLYESAASMDFVQLCRQMNIVDGPTEFVSPKNVGLMFFNEHPERFFPEAQIDIVHFPQGKGVDSFTENVFKGPLNRMLQNALSHIHATVIQEKVIKHSDRPEASRFFNYPFAAIEEAVCNAVYHRDYEIREPVEIQILPDEIIVTSFPGPDRSIRKEDIEQYHFPARRYRNRRLGEFLKELELTEGRGTGIPKILRKIEANGSPAPSFITDEDRTYFVVKFPIHSSFLKNNAKMENGSGKKLEEGSEKELGNGSEKNLGKASEVASGNDFDLESGSEKKLENGSEKELEKTSVKNLTNTSEQASINDIELEKTSVKNAKKGSGKKSEKTSVKNLVNTSEVASINDIELEKTSVKKAKKGSGKSSGKKLEKGSGKNLANTSEVASIKDIELEKTSVKYAEKGSGKSSGKKLEKGSGKSSGKKLEKGSGKKLDSILILLQQTATLTIPDISKELGISTRAVEKYFRALKKAGKLKREGTRKEGLWVVL